MIIIAALLCAIWLISFIGFFDPATTLSLALIPREIGQWWGVFTSLFVHRDLTHLAANSAPLTVFLFLLLLRAKGERMFLFALSGCWLLGAVGLWCVGRSGAHIGASGLVFALFGFLVANAYFVRRWVDVLIAGPVLLGYWGLTAGLYPGNPQISWDGHLSGLIAGIATSWGLSKPFLYSRLVS